jgi:type III pantothenate kinase
MTYLLVDIGNTRMKWALWRNGKIGRQYSAPVADRHTFKKWLARTGKLHRVIAVCVADAAYEYALTYTLQQAEQPAPQFIRSSPRAAGVRNGYRDAWRLGADRWVAAIGAWHEAGSRRAVVAVDVGTALTIDVVDASGQHRGGLIAPGPSLMVHSLLRNTRGIARRAAGRKKISSAPARAIRPLADNTRNAIELGSLIAAAALVDRVVTEIRTSLRKSPVVFVTGGAADQLTPLLRCTHRSEPELVLRGLALFADGAIGDKA